MLGRSKRLLPQKETHHNHHMSLEMNIEKRKDFMSRARARYALLQGRKEKGALIDAVMQFVGYKSRKHVIHALDPRRKKHAKHGRGRSKKLGPKQVEFIRELWSAMGYPCGKRMQPVLSDWVCTWEKQHGCLREPLPELSAATLDRVLASFKVRRARERPDLLETTRLKKSIPLVERKRQPEEPGHMSADTVAHCDGDMSGDFVWTLTLADEYTGWTQNRAIWNKGQHGTCTALARLLREAPFRIRSINTDNGSEFINYHLQRYLKEHYKSCKMTRSRPCMKNGNARVEERNRHVVRECIGYARLDDPRFVRALNRLYKSHNLLLNHFTAWRRLLSKERRGSRIVKKYDKPRTPYCRVMEHLKEGKRRQNLKKLHESLNPWKLREEVEAAAAAILSLQEKIRREPKDCFPVLQRVDG